MKKQLTNETGSARIAMFRPLGRVPCKLNNVTKRKHQTEQSFEDCTKGRLSTRLSQLRGKGDVKQMKL